MKRTTSRRARARGTGAAAERRGAVGRGVRRPDGPAKVSGAERYPEDLVELEGTLYAATVRAPIAAGRLARLDVRRALRVTGVVRVLTARDVAGSNRFGLMTADQPVLVEDWVGGASDVVAVVIGTSAAAARAGAERVRVAVTPTRLVLDPMAALEPGAPVVQPSRRGRAVPNLLATRVLRRERAEAALRTSAVVIEGTYRTPLVDHAFLAPEAGRAYPDGEGGLVLEVASQWPEADLRQAASALGERPGALRLVQTAIGGAFGGREDVSLQLLLLLAARVMDRPVRMAWSRAESVRGRGKRHPFVIRHRLGADRRGRLTAVAIDLVIDAGCYASTSKQLLDNAVAQATGPYRVPAVMVRGRAVLTHNPYTCAFRGFGVNQVAFAMEQQIGKLAARLGLDPAEVRRINLLGRGDPLGAGGVVGGTSGLGATLAAALRRTGLGSGVGGGATPTAPRLAAVGAGAAGQAGTIRRGWGLAMAAKNIGYGFGSDDRATAEVVVQPSGVEVRSGAAEVGQGVSAVLGQIAADTLGVPYRRVRVVWRDTAVAPEAGSSSASRQTVIAGQAVRRACLAARRRTAGLGRIPAGGVVARATARAAATVPLGRGERGRHWLGVGWATTVAEVAVDVETGAVEVVRVVNAIDAGRVIHPALFEGQSEGGVTMGVGYALQEECRVVAGLPVALGFERNGVPTVLDAPALIETVAIESGNGRGPFGAQGIGEIAMIPVVPAITAAIYDACGVWIDELPASPARIRSAIAAREGPRRRPR